jgi:hypothetical protein
MVLPGTNGRGGQPGLTWLPRRGSPGQTEDQYTAIRGVSAIQVRAPRPGGNWLRSRSARPAVGTGRGPGVLEGSIQPGRVFDRTIRLDQAPDGYRAMDNREALKILIRP